jgi:hypothetical protein
MAFPKKGLRKIVVADTKYGYNITGNDDFISFSIGLLEMDGEIITGSFNYHSNYITNFSKDGKPRSWSLFQRIKITPKTIKLIIEYGLRNGWDPKNKKGQLKLGYLDEKLNLNLKQETPFPELNRTQVALNFAKLDTGHLLKVNKELYQGEGEIYQVFDSFQIAKEYTVKIIQEDPSIECWVMNEKNNAIFYLSSIEEKDFK